MDSEADPSLHCCRLGVASRRDIDDSRELWPPCAVRPAEEGRDTQRVLLGSQRCCRDLLVLGTACGRGAGACGKPGLPTRPLRMSAAKRRLRDKWLPLFMVRFGTRLVGLTPHSSALIKVDPTRCCLVGWGLREHQGGLDVAFPNVP